MQINNSHALRNEFIRGYLLPDAPQDIRWKQQFIHFQKAFRLLEQAMTKDHPSDAERAGLIHFFEMSFAKGTEFFRIFPRKKFCPR